MRNLTGQNEQVQCLGRTAESQATAQELVTTYEAVVAIVQELKEDLSLLDIKINRIEEQAHICMRKNRFEIRLGECATVINVTLFENLISVFQHVDLGLLLMPFRCGVHKDPCEYIQHDKQCEHQVPNQWQCCEAEINLSQWCFQLSPVNPASGGLQQRKFRIQQGTKMLFENFINLSFLELKCGHFSEIHGENKRNHCQGNHCPDE
mmetsp:Transcript_67337/g.124009  ORF Transcript_67337/g.124009 Transcript_67337/m.124009 type:complete len:207 (-) Transcript_67337:582-1202(-)